MAKFTPHTQSEINEMLAVTGMKTVQALFHDITPEMAPKSFALPAGLTEYEALEKVKALAAKNRTDYTIFAGGGYYDHFIPAAVEAISSRAEFYTAYTPYQPEASQGTLQAIFEYQTMIARLTGLEAVNASLYDGGTALYEAAAIAVRTNNRTKIVVDKGVNPNYIKILKTYCINQSLEIIEADLKEISTDREKIKALVDESVSALILSNPNFFGRVDDYSDLFEYARSKGALSILIFYPISLGLLKTPFEMKADIAVGEGQSLGMPLSFGGPYLGVMAADKKLIRKMPGRIVGETVDKNGKRCFVLTLQAREQHIRREKATSNICSNQALCALRAVVYLALMGKQGFKDTAQLCFERAEYLKMKLSKIKGIKIIPGVTFNELTVELPSNAAAMVTKMEAKGYLAGTPASLFFKGMEKLLIVAVTEKRSEKEIDRFVAALAEVL